MTRILKSFNKTIMWTTASVNRLSSLKRSLLYNKIISCQNRTYISFENSQIYQTALIFRGYMNDFIGI